MNPEHNDGGPAFPHGPLGDSMYGEDGRVWHQCPAGAGMSLRDWFAGQALAGVMSKVPVTAPSFAADVVVECADAVLAALGRKEKTMSDDNVVQWSENPPSTPGFYWFFGDNSYGAMGGHYSGTIPPHIKLHFVEVMAVGNGLSAVAEGRLVPMTRFDPALLKEGYVGVWAEATLPEVPDKQAIVRLCPSPKGENNE